ncbi:endonuclease III [Candidatus Babeliales bacterium]|nr:endonuclease III [Candidatus Babeliales bacterium]MCF7899443.1 endonuclease III [Candidatus Babeliales bacterium]
MKNLTTIKEIISLLKANTKDFAPTLVDYIIKKYGKDPYLILISCILSLRAKDSSTIHICDDLFSVAKTPQEILKLKQDKLEKIIYKSGFYKTKAKNIINITKIILEKYNGKVPKNKEDLLGMPGIGLKTANLVLSQAYNIPAICVDTHVHRISNRLGLIKTKTPENTELALQKIIPEEYWTDLNNFLVKWGQNICTPVSPKCSICKINKYCDKVGVTKSR